MASSQYATFCPLSKACEIVEPKWSLLIMSEIWSGSTHFNEIRRGLPTMSPTLLSRRLRELEENGLVNRIQNPSSGEISYLSTSMGDELAPVAQSLAAWAHRHVDSEVSLRRLDARILMWNMRRKIDQTAMPRNRYSVIQFTFPELPKDQQNYWLISRPGQEIDLCTTDPGHSVDLFISADLKAMTSVWMGHSSLESELAHETVSMIGDPVLARSINAWMVKSIFAKVA